MIYQILPKKKYQFSHDNTIILFKTLATQAKQKTTGSILKRLFINVNFPYKFIIDCDKQKKCAFYFETSDQHAQNSIELWAGEGAEVFETPALTKYEVVDTIYAREAVNKDNAKKERTMMATYTNETIFMNIIGSLEKNTRIVLDFRTSKKSIASTGGRFRMAASTDVELEVLIRVYGKTKYERTSVQSIAHKICNLLSAERNLYVDYKDSWKVFKATGIEMTNVMQLPTLFRKTQEVLKNIYYLMPGQRTLTVSEYAAGIKLGTLYHPMQLDRDVRLNFSELRKHALITGTTGAGKTSEIEEMIEDILLRKVKKEKSVPGFTFFDPAESSVLGIIDKILKLESDGHDVSELLKKVIYIDFKDKDYIFPISLINKSMEPNELMEFLNGLFPDMNTIQVDRMMNSAVKALLMDKDEHSIFDVERIFSDEKFRLRLKSNLSKDMYAKDIVDFLDTKFNQAMVSPILNRVDPFGNSRNKKLMFGMTSKHDALKNLRKWMDEGYIVLCNVKGMNSFDTKTCVGYYMRQAYNTALQRPENALLHLIIVDEDHKVQEKIVSKIAAETRKQGLSVVLMTQQMEQYNQSYLEGLIGNINTVISFRQNDPKACRNVMGFIVGDVEMEDFQVLPDLVGYASITDSDKQKKSVLIKVRPPYRYTNGKLVNYEDDKAMEANMIKNRKFAKEIMKQCMMPKKEAEQIVFKEYFDTKEKEEYETTLLDTGDSFLSVEEGGRLPWED